MQGSPLTKQGYYVHIAYIDEAYSLKDTQETCISGFHG